MLVDAIYTRAVHAVRDGSLDAGAMPAMVTDLIAGDIVAPEAGIAGILSAGTPGPPTGL